MDKIPFQDGTKIKNATVTINEQEYEVTPAQYQGTTPMSAFNLNKMQDNIENTLVKVSATEPSTKADVWIKHNVKNMFNPSSIIEGGYNTTTGEFITSSSTYATANKIEVISNKKIVLSKGGKAIATRFFFYEENGTFISSIVQQTTPITIPTNAKYLNLQITKETAGNSLQDIQLEYDNVSDFEAPVDDDIFVNDNGAYNSVLNNDTGWQDLTLQNATNFDWAKMKIRKIGKVVYVTGGMTLTNNARDTIYFKVPYLPENGIPVLGGVSSSSNLVGFYLTSTGDFKTFGYTSTTSKEFYFNFSYICKE